MIGRLTMSTWLKLWPDLTKHLSWLFLTHELSTHFLFVKCLIEIIVIIVKLVCIVCNLCFHLLNHDLHLLMIQMNQSPNEHLQAKHSVAQRTLDQGLNLFNEVFHDLLHDLKVVWILQKDKIKFHLHRYSEWPLVHRHICWSKDQTSFADALHYHLKTLMKKGWIQSCCLQVSAHQ